MADHPEFWLHTLKDLFCGSLAGVAICVSGHPFDTLKVRL
jgi:hypothetical protein